MGENLSEKQERFLSARFKYWFDQIISGGTGKLLFLLAACSMVLVGVAAMLQALGITPIGSEPLNYAESFWRTMGLALSPDIVDDEGWVYRLVMLAVAILGILIVSTLIGVLTSGIEGRIEGLRRGRSMVLERDHTVILGWSSKIVTAVQELVIANENQPKAAVVILANHDKVEMEEELYSRVTKLGNTKIICRRGDPCVLSDLEIVRPEFAKSIILFSGEDEQGDAVVLKRALALQRVAERHNNNCHIVAEIRDDTNTAAIKLVGNVEVVQSVDLVTRVLVQAARQPGLSLVYDELLSFKGCEIYFHKDISLADRTFADAILSMPRAAVIGIKPQGSDPVINPPADRIIETDDMLILVAEDDSKINIPEKSQPTFDMSKICQPPEISSTPEHYIILGWHRGGAMLIQQLNKQLTPGASVLIVHDPDLSNGPSHEDLNTLERLNVTVQTGKTTLRPGLERLDLSLITKIIVLSYRDSLPIQEADSMTLLTLVHIRDLCEITQKRIGIATEMLDAKNRELASQKSEDDFIASEELVSKVLVQLSENSQLAKVLDELLTSDGSELYLRPAAHYVELGAEVPFGAIVAAGLSRKELAIGILKTYSTGKLAELLLALKKIDSITLGAEDSIVVVAQD
jgi:voltage-gated potassium channel Kch